MQKFNDGFAASPDDAGTSDYLEVVYQLSKKTMMGNCVQKTAPPYKFGAKQSVLWRNHR
ncbi:MAG: hypothetical protein HOP23_02480 [Methylococcaceae bacterium]|nr:hypothetical protein [Methylococcaceae bacterium]